MRMKITSRIPLICLLLGSVFSQAMAEEKKETESYVQHAESLFSTILNEQRKVTVQLPKSYKASPDKAYPVIYRLDGNGAFPLITSVMEQLQGANSAPEVIIVGIENTDRLRDLYATENKDPYGPQGVGGGALKFLQFIETELIPLIDKKYRTHDFRIIAGASAAGVFSLYAMEQKPELFDAHLAYSPAVWWNHGASAKRLKTFLKNTKELDNYVYMNIGEEGGMMRPIYDDLRDFMLQNQPKNFTFVTDTDNTVPHSLTAVAGVFNAYHKLFLPMYMPLRYFDKDVKSIDKYYQRLSSQWGIDQKPVEAAVRNLGYHFVDEEDFDTAIAIFKYDVGLYPETPDSHWGLAYTYDLSGNIKLAVEHINNAVKVADESYPYYQRLLDEQKHLSSQLK